MIGSALVRNLKPPEQLEALLLTRPDFVLIPFVLSLAKHEQDQDRSYAMIGGITPCKQTQTKPPVGAASAAKRASANHNPSPRPHVVVCKSRLKTAPTQLGFIIMGGAHHENECRADTTTFVARTTDHGPQRNRNCANALAASEFGHQKTNEQQHLIYTPPEIH